MGLRDWWSRRRRGSAQDDRGSAARALTEADEASIMVMAQQAFAEAGREVVPDSDGTLIGDHMTYGTTNLRRTLQAEQRSDWPELIRNHVSAMIAADTNDEPLIFSEVSDRLLFKLRLAEDLPEVPAYAPEPAPGLLALLAIDHPTHVQELLGDKAVGELGPFDELRRLAMDNLRALPPPEHQMIEANDDPAATVHLFFADDFFGASRLLIIDEVLQAAGVATSKHGHLVAFPHRHVLAVHPVTGTGVVAAMQVMLNIARGEHDSRPGPITPELYHRDVDGSMIQISTTSDDGNPGIVVSGSLERAFQGLRLLE